jgi:hypothetical protein
LTSTTATGTIWRPRISGGRELPLPLKGRGFSVHQNQFYYLIPPRWSCPNQLEPFGSLDLWYFPVPLALYRRPQLWTWPELDTQRIQWFFRPPGLNMFSIIHRMEIESIEKTENNMAMLLLTTAPKGAWLAQKNIGQLPLPRTLMIRKRHPTRAARISALPLRRRRLARRTSPRA